MSEFKGNRKTPQESNKRKLETVQSASKLIHSKAGNELEIVIDLMNDTHTRVVFWPEIYVNWASEIEILANALTQRELSFQAEEVSKGNHCYRFSYH